MRGFRIFVLPVIFCIAFFTFVVVYQVHADNTKAERWFCLNSKLCGDNDAKCSGKGIPGHRVQLTVKDIKALPNIPTYIFECVATNQSQLCTTGDPNVDKQVFGTTSPLQTLATAVGYSFKGVFQADGLTASANPLQTSTGDIGPLEWESSSSDVSRKFMAMNYYDPYVLQGNQGGQQQGTFPFDTAQKTCVSIHWDPDGRVFDSKSFEPIAKAKVSLYVQRTNGQFELLNPAELGGSSVINPFTTQEDGYFKFVVPDGTYQLKVAASGYTFESQLAQSPNFKTTTYKNMYPSQTGQDIVQKGAIQHRDIPVDSKGTPTNSPVKLMEYFYTLNKLTSSLLIEGHTSHPFTIIKSYAQIIPPSGSASNVTPQRGTLLNTTTTDKDGQFVVTIPLSSIPANQVFGSVELVKATLTASQPQNVVDRIITKIKQLFIHDIYAQQQTTVMKFEPILNYIEGYAYDAKGVAIPNATVGIYLNFSSKPYIEVKADSKGYYQIGSELLPSMGYKIRYTSPSGANTDLTSSTFMKQNTTYLTQNKIDLTKPKTTTVLQTTPGARQSTPSAIPTFFRSDAVADVTKTPAGNATNSQTSGAGNMMLIVLAVVALIASVVVLIIFALKKRQQPPV